MIDSVSQFLAEGGTVLKVILAVTFVMWVFIFERLFFFAKKSPVMLGQTAENFKELARKSQHLQHWKLLQIRDYYMSRFKQEQFQNLDIIKTLVNLCPLLGLLGTVTGMIAVFDVMAITGTGNARLMASGISMATIPTMAGMVTSLAGLYFSAQLDKKAKGFSAQLRQHLEEIE